MQPDEIPVGKITHLIAAFGYITPSTYTVTNVIKLILSGKQY